METKIIEAAQSLKADPQLGFNWGKFMICRMTDEWQRTGAVPVSQGYPALPLLSSVGWSHLHIWVLDLQTGEGACFRPGGSSRADLMKHKVWVCPLFEPFLEWLYHQDLKDLQALPDAVELPDAPAAFSGYRRPGPDEPQKDRFARFSGCEGVLDGHKHCKHGHTVNCPDPDNCDLIEEAEHDQLGTEAG